MWKQFLVLLVLLRNTESRSVVINFESCHHEFNTDIIQNMTLDLTNDGIRNVVNGGLTVVTDLPKFQFMVRITLPRSNGRLFTLFNTTVDGCDYLNTNLKKTISLPLRIMKNIRKYLKNMPTKCPVPKGTKVIISNLYVDADLPSYFHETTFQFLLAVQKDSVNAFKIFVNGSTTDRRTLSKGTKQF